MEVVLKALMDQGLNTVLVIGVAFLIWQQRAVLEQLRTLNGKVFKHAEDIAWLREQADIHRGQPSDQKRRSALNYAATAMLQRKRPGRPNAGEVRG